MKHLTTALLLTGLICALGYFVLTHGSRDEARRLEGELAKLQKKNQHVADENGRLRAQVVALRNDPRLAERRARESAGLARPDELIYQFEDASPREGVTIELKVAPDGGMTLAGKSATSDELPGQLKSLHKELPDAKLKILVPPHLDALSHQRVRDLVADSAFREANAVEEYRPRKPRKSRKSGKTGGKTRRKSKSEKNRERGSRTKRHGATRAG